MRSHIRMEGRSGGGMPSASIGGYYSYINSPNLENIDITSQIGGSVDVGASVGADFVAALNADHTESGYVGGTLYVGLGLTPTAVEGHGTFGKTKKTWYLVHGDK